MHLWPKTSEERLKTNEDGGRLARPIEKELKTTARKTTTSSEVKNRWNAAHYTRLTIVLDKDDAAAYKAKCEQAGMSYSDVPKEAIYDFLREH